MSVSRPSQCLICTFSRSIRLPKPPRRKFHTSLAVREDKPPPQRPDEDVDIRKEGQRARSIKKEEWSKYYSPEQVKVIEEANKAIAPKRFEDGEGLARTDPWSVDYYDDFTNIHPVVDKPVRAPWENLDANLRMKTEDELSDDMVKLMRDLPDTEEGPDDFWTKFDKNLRLTVGKEVAERNPRSAMAPELPKLEDSDAPKKKSTKPGEKQEVEDDSPALVRLMQMTGYSRRQLSSLRVKTIVVHSVVNQTRMGKIRKQYFLSVAGNAQGLVGIGEGKSIEAGQARLQSQYRAIRNMQPVLRYEGRTIFGHVSGKVSATELELYARPPGFGLRCQGYIWEICKCAGISDIAARVTRSRNPMNTVKATIKALLSQKDPEDIARARGKKLVDVRKVYYAGQL